jgi:hypothetical protein
MFDKDASKAFHPSRKNASALKQQLCEQVFLGNRYRTVFEVKVPPVTVLKNLP